MAYERIAKRAGRNRGRNSEPIPVSQQGWRGVNYVDNLYEMQPHQIPYAKNVDLGNPIGSISKVAGRESLFASLGAGQIKGLHTWKHPDGDKLIAAWDKYLYLLSGASGSIVKTSQADWEAGTGTHTDTATSPGDIKLAKTGVDFSETDTLTADFNGTHSDTVAASDAVELDITTDTNTVLLLHCNGTNGSTTFTDETGKTVTAEGSAQLSTAQKKFGTASGYFHGLSDYLTVPDSDDWYFGSGDFTIDLWVRFTDLPTTSAPCTLLRQYVSSSPKSYWRFRVINESGTYKLQFEAYNNDDPIVSFKSDALTLTENTWMHLAVVRSGNTWFLFKDGTQVGSTTKSNRMPNYSAVLEIARDRLYGYLDEIRISKGVARWTSDFTVPTSEYNITGYAPSGIYTHPVQNISGIKITTGVTIAFNETTPTSTTVTVETRISTDGGSTWGSWTTRTSGDTIIASGTDVSNYRVQWRAILTTTDNAVTPSLNDVTLTGTTGYYTSGSWVSPAYDMVNTPLTAVLSWVHTTPSGTSLTWYARGSGDGTVFGDWQEIVASGGAIPLQRYVQVKFLLIGTLTVTPTVSSLLINYSTSYSQANRLDISPLGRTDNLLTGNRVSMQDYENRCYCADGLRPFVLYVTDTTVATGTAQSLAGNTIELAAGASAVDDFYNNAFVTITGGGYAGRTGFINDYIGSTKIATLNTWLFDDSYTFSRSSTAYKQDGTQVASGVPRYETQGVYIDRPATNVVLDPSFENADITANWNAASFSDWAYTGTARVRDTTYKKYGSASAKCGDGTNSAKGMAEKNQGTSAHAVSADQNWTLSFDVYATDAAQYIACIRCYDASGNNVSGTITPPSGWQYSASYAALYFTGTPAATGIWQRIAKLFTVPTDVSYVAIALMYYTGGTAKYIWFDGVQFEQYVHDTGFTDGTRNADVLTVPTSGVLNASKGTIELYYEVTAKTQVSGMRAKYLFFHGTSGSPGPGGSYPNAIGLYITATAVYAFTCDADGYISSPGWATTLSIGVHKFTVAWDASELVLLVDGVRRASVASPKLPSSLASNFTVGGWSYGTGYEPCGIVYNVRVSSRKRSDAEDQAEYDTGLPLARNADTTYLANFIDPAGTTYSIGKAVKVREAGVDPPTTAPTLADSGTAGSPNGTYYGKVTFVNAEGYESNPSPASASLSVTSKQITWTVPVDSSAGNTTASRKLYRTKAGGSVYYYVATINNNTTTTYTDNIADSSLTVLMLDNNNIPPNASLVYEFLTYMFYTYFDELWFSKAGEPESVPNITGDIQMNVCPGTILDIKTNPMALIPMGDNFIAPITTNTGFVFDSDPTVDTTTMRVIDKNGCFSAWASDICISPDLRSILVFPTNTGVRTLLPGLQEESIESIPLSRNVQPYFDRAVNRTNMAGVFFESRYIISFEHMPVGGAKSEYITFVYDFRTNEWYGPWMFGASCYTISGNVLYAGDPEVGKIYRMFTGSSFDGANIEMIADLPMISPQENRTYKFLNFTAMVSSDSNTSQTLVKPKVDSREATIALGTLTDTFTGDTRPGHNNLRTKKYKIPLPRGNTLSYRIYDNSTNPVSVQKIITELEPLPLKK